MQFSNKQAELNELRQIISFYYPKDSAIGFKIHLLFSLFILLLSHLVFQVHKRVPCIEVATLRQILNLCVQAKSKSDACLTQLKWTFNGRFKKNEATREKVPQCSVWLFLGTTLQRGHVSN